MAYGTVAAWIAYAAARGLTVTAGTLADQALERASDYIRTRYVGRYSLDAASAEVVEATYIAAAFELATPGFFSATYTPAQAKVLTKVEGIEWTVVGGMSGRDAMVPISAAIDGLLVPRSFGLAMMVV